MIVEQADHVHAEYGNSISVAQQGHGETMFMTNCFKTDTYCHNDFNNPRFPRAGRVVIRASCCLSQTTIESVLLASRISRLTLYHPLFCIPTASQLPLPRLLSNNLVSVSVVPLLAVGKEPVDDDSADREDEDENRPEELVADRAGRLEDLD